MIKAYAKVLQDNDDNLKLVLTGGLGWRKQYLFELIKAYGIKSYVIFLPYVHDNELPVIYKQARALIYISPYEGFGIPVLEAMASYLPVLASAIPPIKEFAEGSALLIDHDDQSTVENGLKEIIYNSNLRQKIIENQKKNIAKYTWSNSAKIILKTFNSFEKDQYAKRKL